MAEHFELTLVPSDVDEPLVTVGVCTLRKRHTPSAMWNWRCEVCSCLLCTSCRNPIDDCGCSRPEARHG